MVLLGLVTKRVTHFHGVFIEDGKELLWPAVDQG